MKNKSNTPFAELISKLDKTQKPAFRIFVFSRDSKKIIYKVNDKNNSNRHSTVITFGIELGTTYLITLNRGKILEMILKIEFLLSQIIFVYMNDKDVKFFDQQFWEKWNYLLEKISFFERIMLLRRWKLSKPETNKHLKIVREVRNQLAHTLDTDYIYYDHPEGRKLWKDDQKGLREILEKCWNGLLDIYQDIWDQEELAEYILNQLEKIHTESRGD